MNIALGKQWNIAMGRNEILTWVGMKWYKYCPRQGGLISAPPIPVGFRSFLWILVEFQRNLPAKISFLPQNCVIPVFTPEWSPESSHQNGTGIQWLELVLPELGSAWLSHMSWAKRSCSHRLDASSGWTPLMSQLIDGIASSAMALWKNRNLIEGQVIWSSTKNQSRMK